MPAELIIEDSLDCGGLSEIAIPFEVAACGDGVTTVRACAELEAAARDFINRFAGIELSPEAVAFIESAAAPLLERENLVPTGDCGSMRIFRYNGAPDTIYNGRPAGEACEAVPFDPSAGFDNLTTFDLDYMYSLGQRILVVIRDNAVVSAAAASPCGGDRAELSVETADGYTGRGYASACAAALARMLHEEGVTALYLAQEDNPASHAAARKAGFGEAGGMYQLVCRKKTKRRKFRFRKFLV